MKPKLNNFDDEFDVTDDGEDIWTEDDQLERERDLRLDTNKYDEDEFDVDDISDVL